MVWSIAHTSFALTVSPAKMEITIDPGKVHEGRIEIFNEQDTDKTFFISYENFEPRGDSGAPYFIGAESGLATWIETSPQVTVAPGGRAYIPYTVNVPPGTEPGGYFSAIFFGSQPPKTEGGGEVSIGGKIGVLLLLRVSGYVEEGGGLIDFTSKDDQVLFSTLPVSFEYRLNNTGGDRIVPFGEIKIKNTFRLNSAVLFANENNGSVLPSSTRKFEVTWKSKIPQTEDTESKKGFFLVAKNQLKDFRFGWYTADLNLVWGTTNQTANASYNFFVFPWQLLLIISTLLLVIGFVGKIGLRRYNRFIIAQAMQVPKQK